MGSNSGDSDEKPVHRVTLTRGFQMQTTEVTQGQWYDVMGTRPWSGKDFVQKNRDNPAVYVSWNDAKKFIRKLNNQEGKKYRLPTEAEWEYACRAGSSSKYSFGNSESQLKDYAWFKKNANLAGKQHARKVATKKPNAWGLYDMHGNVWEWCEDWAGSLRVLRGGSWFILVRHCRSAIRLEIESVYWNDDVGFRLVLLPGQ